MRTVGLVMAGGRGERMRASGEERAKPLALVQGRPLVEHNVRRLLRHGVREVVVSARADDRALRALVDEHLEPLVRSAGGRLEVLGEHRPLGNIGGAGALAGRADEVLVVNADNLTAVDLDALLALHRDRGADLTLAAHDEPFPVPYGVLDVDPDGGVVGYAEKPVLRVTVCSAVSVLGPRALRLLPQDRPTGLQELAAALLDAGDRVVAFRHGAAWVDVNDRAGLARAEALAQEHPELLGGP